MLGGMWGVRFDSKKNHRSDLSPATAATDAPSDSSDEGQESSRSVVASLVTDMLHSPISWASVYLADQACQRNCFIEYFAHAET